MEDEQENDHAGSSWRGYDGSVSSDQGLVGAIIDGRETEGHVDSSGMILFTRTGERDEMEISIQPSENETINFLSLEDRQRLMDEAAVEVNFSWPYHPDERSLIGYGPPPRSFTSFFMNPKQFDPRCEILHRVNAEGDTALFIAAKTGHDEAVNVLLSVPETQINWHNHKGITALSAAAHKGRASIVDVLIQAGANVNAESNNGSTPLIQASHFGHVEVVKLLVNAGANVDRPNNKGTTALMRATQEGKEEVVRLLIASGADVSRRNNERMNALMLGSQRGHASIVRLLIAHHAEVDGQTAQGSTALMLACKRGHAEVVQVLLVAGAEIHIKDTRGRTARDTAARRWYHEILESLTGDKQMRLMQDAARVERSKIFHWMYRQNLHIPSLSNQSTPTEYPRLKFNFATGSSSRGSPIYTGAMPRCVGTFGGEMTFRPPSLNSSDSPLWVEVLRNCMNLPRFMYEKIIDYVPLPRLWEDSLARLRRRCHIDSNEAVKGGLQMIDEIFADLCVASSSTQKGYMVRISRSDALKERLLGSKFNMPKILLSLCCDWSDVQSLCMRIERGISYDIAIAVQVVHLAGEIFKWNRCSESQREYVLDHSAAVLLSHGSIGEVVGAFAGGDGMEEVAQFESDSSDSEMDA